MERTKYTPKRLLSLLLALIMLLGLFPTAVFAAGETTRPIGSVRGDGLICELFASFSNGPHFAGEQLPIRISYRFKTQISAEYVKQINSYSVGIYPTITAGATPIHKEESSTAISAESEADSSKTESITTGSTSTKVYKNDVVITEGSFNITGTIGENGAVALYSEMLADFDIVKHGTVETGKVWDGGRATAECVVPLTYTVGYKSDLTGAAGLDTTTHYTTTEDNNQVFTIEANDPTLDNYKFKGWAVNGDTSRLYKKGDKLTITANATLTAVWEKAEETQTHTVSFVADVTGVSQMPDAIIVPKGQKVSGVLDVNTMAKPQLADHTFLYWAEEENGGTPFSFDTVPTKDITLHAVFARNEVDITWPTETISGVQSLNKNHTSVPKGSTVSFNITLQPGYQFNQGDVLVDGIPLGWTIKENTDKTTTYYFSFVANAEPTVEGQKATMAVRVNDPSIKKQVITLPSGTGYYATFTDCSTGASAANGKSSYEFSYGDTFEIELHVTGAKKTVTLVVDGQTHIVGDKRGMFYCTDNSKKTITVTDQPINISVRVEEQYTWRVDYVLLPNVGNYGAVDKVSHQPSRYAIMRKTA